MSVTVNAYHHLPLIEVVGLMLLAWALATSYQLIKHELHRRYCEPIIDAVDRDREPRGSYAEVD